MKTFWVNFLHFYLPPTSEPEIVDEAVNRSYSWILEMAKKYKNFRFTLNLSGCLTEMLAKRRPDIIAKFHQLLDKQQLELVDSLAYHPIAPLLSEKETIRQIKLNEKINKQHLGKTADGFFLPEMAYSPSLGKIIDELGYKWLILDEISHQGRTGKIDWHNRYVLENSNLTIIYRSRNWSKDYPPRQIIKELTKLPPYIISATDAELYGHRFVDWEGWLARVVNHPNIKCLTISQYLATLKNTITTKPLPSNWESLEKEIIKLPFSLWFNKKNRIQNLLWHLAQLALSEVEKNPTDENWHWARRHLDRGLPSCTFWWASGRDFHLFGAPAWKPDEVEKGATELIKVIRTLKVLTGTKLKAEKYYHHIKKMLWTKHWKKYDR